MMDKITITVGLDEESINHTISQLSKIRNGICGSLGNVSSANSLDVRDITFNPTQGDKNIKDVKETFTANKVGETKSVTSSLPELDNADMPWDIRIHSGAKTKTTNGIWKKRKGVTKEDYASISDEIMGKSSEVVVDDEYDDDEEELDPNLVFSDNTTQPRKITQIAGTGPMTHNELMAKATKAMTEDYMDFQAVVSILQKFPGTNGLPAKHPGMLKEVEYKDCIDPIAVAMSQHVHLCGGTW
jgi:hypothetical protein